MRRVQLCALFVLSLTVPGVAAAADPPTLSTTDRLSDRRYVASGPHAYVVGTEDGRFPAAGWHIRGEMGGVWTAPLKLLDGIWFAVDGTWLPKAERFTSGWGYVQMDIPVRAGLTVTRTDTAPDDRHGVLVRLRFSNTSGAAQSFSLGADAHSELLSAYPWGWTTPSAQASNLPDSAAYDSGALLFSDQGTPPGGLPAHDWAAAVGATEAPTGHDTGTGFRGPQDPPTICPMDGPAPYTCDDSAMGKGAGGQLTYDVTVPAGGTKDVWFGVAGSDSGTTAARTELDALLNDPAAELAAKVAGRQALGDHTRLSLPGDPLLAQGIDWSKQNLADAVQEADDLQVRDVNEGKAFPAAAGTVSHMRFVGAGFPDYPWLFATDGEYTAFASVALGQFGPIKDHLRALRDVSVALNGTSGKVVHEVVTDGSVYFGGPSNPGNTDESAKFPSAVALVWRWTGDNAFLGDLYPFARQAMRHVVQDLDSDADGWPEGPGNVERTGMGEEKLDNAVYAIRGLYDLADMAQARRDGVTRGWALGRANDLRDRFESAWWMSSVPGYADSLDDPGDHQLYQRHWIGATPMEAELTDPAGHATPGLAQADRGNATLDVHERACYGTQFGFFHTARPGCDGAPDSPAEERIFTLNTAIMAVGEGNYGRLGADQQQRFTTANRRLQLPNADEQPGAMPEEAPSPFYGTNIDRALYDRSMVLQSWGAYGTAWPVVHQQLGVRPDLGAGRLEVVPQVPGADPIAGDDIRLGSSGSVDVRAARAGTTYTTTVFAHLPVKLRIGATLPAGASVAAVTLDGAPVTYAERTTNRGREVTVAASPGTSHTLVVTTG
jgi:hypothetical protein